MNTEKYTVTRCDHNYCFVEQIEFDTHAEADEFVRENNKQPGSDHYSCDTCIDEAD